MAVWSQSLYIVVPLVLVILGHWSLLLQGMAIMSDENNMVGSFFDVKATQLKAEYIPGTGCAITQTNNTILAATFIYSMCFDALVMVLSAIKLLRRQGRSQVVALLFKDGLIYFIASFIANLIATVFMVLNLNSVMSVIFNVPAAVVSTTFSCRAVRRLTTFKLQGPEVFQSSSGSGGVLNFFSGNVPASGDRQKQTVPRDMSGVHVQMQTFTVADDVRNYSRDARPRAVDLESADTVLDLKPEAL
ncbi:uncharacterized protein FIBRA_01600 [Fibroporia radiculosa]|uniref:Transmembrane protein n=1 Tax=Fibroporia radiculosa TaxID=599839 RepID=J4HTL3_9APHY|nr:uncharacterized protein FIBRA_01600 [Fibroporia radiculosa]CCL99582.1 predicted protein [Fibroporia radiculosa]